MFGYKGVATSKSLRCPNMEKTHKLAYYYVKAFNMRHEGETHEETWTHAKQVGEEEEHQRLSQEAATGVHTEFGQQHKPEVEIIQSKHHKIANLPGAEKADAQVLEHIKRVTKRSRLVKRESMMKSQAVSQGESQPCPAVHCLKAAFATLSETVPFAASRPRLLLGMSRRSLCLLHCSSCLLH